MLKVMEYLEHTYTCNITVHVNHHAAFSINPSMVNKHQDLHTYVTFRTF